MKIFKWIALSCLLITVNSVEINNEVVQTAFDDFKENFTKLPEEYVFILCT